MILIELSKHKNQDLLPKIRTKSEDFFYFKPWELPTWTGGPVYDD